MPLGIPEGCIAGFPPGYPKGVLLVCPPGYPKGVMLACPPGYPKGVMLAPTIRLSSKPTNTGLLFASVTKFL